MEKNADVVLWFLHSKNVFQHDLLLEMFDHKLELVGRCVSLAQHVRVDVLCCNLGNDLPFFLQGVVFRSDSWRKILFCLIDVFICPIKFPTVLLIHLLCIDRRNRNLSAKRELAFPPGQWPHPQSGVGSALLDHLVHVSLQTFSKQEATKLW